MTICGLEQKVVTSFMQTVNIISGKGEYVYSAEPNDPDGQSKCQKYIDDMFPNKE